MDEDAILPIEIPSCLIVKDEDNESAKRYKLDIFDCKSPKPSYLLFMGLGCGGCKHVFSLLLAKLQKEPFYFFYHVFKGDEESNTLINGLEIVHVPYIMKIDPSTLALIPVLVNDVISVS